MGYLHRLQRWPSTRYLLLFVFSLALSGCSKEKMDEMVAVAKEQSQSFVESPVIASVLPATGKAEVQLTTPVAMNAAYARIHTIGDGRPNVVQLTSYEPSAGPVEYPSLLIRLLTDATSLDQLSGRSIDGRIFFQESGASPVLSTTNDKPVSVTFAAIDPEKKTLDASVGPLTFRDPNGNVIEAMGLTIEGLLP